MSGKKVILRTNNYSKSDSGKGSMNPFVRTAELVKLLNSDIICENEISTNIEIHLY